MSLAREEENGVVFSDHEMASDSDEPSQSEEQPLEEEEPAAIDEDAGCVFSCHEESSSSLSSSSSTSGLSDSERSENSQEIEKTAMPPLHLPVHYGDYVFVKNTSVHKTQPSRSHVRIQVACACLDRGRCSKRRGKGARRTQEFGAWEPIAFLLAWARAGRSDQSRKMHVHYEPLLEEVREAFLELKNHFGS